MSQPYFPTLVVGGNTISFPHLEPMRLIVPTISKPAGVTLDVVFSNHCFSERFDPSVHRGPVVDVWDGPIRRVFDQTRFALSTALPGIVEGLPISPVFLTPEANFVRITLAGAAPGVDYRMYFRLSRGAPGAGYDLKMRVESAYSPKPEQALAAHHMTKVRFVVLVDKTMRGEKVKRHQKR